jgi:hypothetical protein
MQTTEDRIDERCDALVIMVKATRHVYLRASKYQQDFIETVVGAAIWYLPRMKTAWTGKISLAAVKSFGSAETVSPKLSEEHVFPRKAAARRILLDKHLSSSSFRKQYRDIYGKLHYITPAENRRIVSYQKSDEFTTKTDIYAQADIILINVSDSDLSHIKKRDGRFIDEIVRKYDKLQHLH